MVAAPLFLAIPASLTFVLLVAGETGPTFGPSASYGFAGVLLAIAVAGGTWWAKASERRERLLHEEAAAREDRLRAENAGLRAEIRELNDRIANDIVPLAMRATEATAQMARLFDRQVDDLRQRERG